MLFKLRLIHDVCRNSRCKDNTQKGKMQIIGGKITILFVFFMRLLQNAKSNENSSSKIEEVPEGRRSMMVQNGLIINIVNRR